MREHTAMGAQGSLGCPDRTHVLSHVYGCGALGVFELCLCLVCLLACADMFGPQEGVFIVGQYLEVVYAEGNDALVEVFDPDCVYDAGHLKLKGVLQEIDKGQEDVGADQGPHDGQEGVDPLDGLGLVLLLPALELRGRLCLVGCVGVSREERLSEGKDARDEGDPAKGPVQVRREECNSAGSHGIGYNGAHVGLNGAVVGGRRRRRWRCGRLTEVWLWRR